MMNIDDIYFQLIMMPFQTLNIKYETRKNNNTYEGIINIKEFRKMFRNTLGKMLLLLRKERGVSGYLIRMTYIG